MLWSSPAMGNSTIICYCICIIVELLCKWLVLTFSRTIVYSAYTAFQSTLMTQPLGTLRVFQEGIIFITIIWTDSLYLFLIRRRADDVKREKQIAWLGPKPVLGPQTLICLSRHSIPRNTNDTRCEISLRFRFYFFLSRLHERRFSYFMTRWPRRISLWRGARGSR